MSKVNISPELVLGRLSGPSKAMIIGVFGTIKSQTSIEYVKDIYPHSACFRVVDAEHQRAWHVLFTDKEVPVHRAIHGVNPAFNALDYACCQLSDGQRQQHGAIFTDAIVASSSGCAGLTTQKNHIRRPPTECHDDSALAVFGDNSGILIDNLSLSSSINFQDVTDRLSKAGAVSHAAYCLTCFQSGIRMILLSNTRLLLMPQRLRQRTRWHDSARQRAYHYPSGSWVMILRSFLTAIQSLKKKQITDIIFNNIPRIFDLQIVGLDRLFGTIVLSVKRAFSSVSRQNALPGHRFTHFYAATHHDVLSQPAWRNRAFHMSVGQWQERLCKSH